VKFRSKPFEVEADQFVVGQFPYPKEVCFCVEAHGRAHFHTSKGIQRINSTDWVLRSATGAVYSRPDHLFKRQYEEVK
jgi:hypothetical protein